MISLTARQTDLAGRAAIAPIGLVVLTTYTDRAAETAGTVFRWGTATVIYDYGNTGSDQTFHGLIRDLEVPERVMNHIPPAVPAVGRDFLRLTVVNDSIDGERLWQSLRGVNLHGATVEASTLLLMPGQFDDYTGAGAWWDLRGLTGDEHLVRFRGELERVGPVSNDAIEMEFRVPEPRVPWVEALDESVNDPRDFGKRLPVIVGQSQRVPCINYQVGAVTTLAEAIGTGTGNVAVTSTAGMSGTMTLQTEAERVTATVVDSQTINISARAVSPTTSASHQAGVSVIELPATGIFAVAGHAVNAIDNLYARNVYSGELTRVTTAFTKTLSDTSTIAGETIATVSFTQAQIIALLEEQLQAAQVTQQPAFETGAESIRIPLTTRASYTPISTNMPFSTMPGGGSSDNAATFFSTTPGLGLTKSGTKNEALVVWLTSGQIPSIEGGRATSRYRIIVDCDFDAPSGGDSELWISARFGGAGILERLYDHTDGSGALLGGSYASSWVTCSGNLSTFAGSGAGSDPRCAIFGRDGGSDGPTAQIKVYNTGGTQIEVEIAGGALTRTTDAAIAAASLGAGLQFYADVDGASVRTNETQQDDFDALGSWSATDGSVALQTATPYEGTGYLELTSNGGSTDPRADDTTLANLDWTGKRFSIAIRVPSATHGNLSADNLAVKLAIGSDVGFGTNWAVYGRPASFVPAADTWYRIEFDIDEEPELSSGTLVKSSVSSIQVGIRLDAATSGKIAHFDDWRVFDRELAESPADATQWFLEDFCGLDQVDATTFATAETNLGSDVMAGNLAGAGEGFWEILARLGFESRTNIVREEGTGGPVYKMLTALSTYAFSASAKTLEEWSDLVEETRARTELATRYRGFYAIDASAGDSEEAYRSLVQIDSSVSDSGTPSTGDLGDAEERFGVVNAEPYFLRLLQDEATAEDVMGYYAHEGIRDAARVFRVRLPHWEGYALERGDIVSLTPDWGDSALKLRVLLVQHQLSGPDVLIVAVEVE